MQGAGCRQNLACPAGVSVPRYVSKAFQEGTEPAVGGKGRQTGWGLGLESGGQVFPRIPYLDPPLQIDCCEGVFVKVQVRTCFYLTVC